MLAYLNPSNTSSAHTSPRQLPTSVVPGTSAPSTLHLDSRSSAPSSTCPSPRFPPHQAPHPATPPSSTIAKAFPRSKTLAVGAGPGKIPRLSLGSASARAAAPVTPGEASRSRRCATVADALAEFEAILMGDDEGSDEESDSTQTGKDVRRGVGTADAGSDSDDVPDLVIEGAQAGPSKQASKGDTKRNMGWTTGVAREFARFQLMVDVPVWSPECGADLSTLHQLRDTTLLALHTIIDDLRLRGVHTTYRICSTPSSAPAPADAQGPAPPVWGCIRVAPPFHTPARISSSALGGNEFALPGPAVPLGSNAFVASGAPGRGVAYLSQARRSTMGPASVTPSSMLGAGGFTGSASINSGGHVLGARPSPLSEDVSSVVRAELEAHKVALGQLCVEEGQSFLVALHGQPALVLT